MTDWKVFQTDVLDIIKQYQGYFDFFERVGNLGDSRPDCFARVTREDKKEIWVLDAKNKDSIDDEDIDRMDKYTEMVASNPVDVGLDAKALAEHEVRGVFVTSAGDIEIEEYEQVKFGALHAFLQRELVYTDTEKVVRDVAKMVEKKQLSQGQARLLFRSIKPFEDRMERALETLRELETRYVGLELREPPLDSYEYDIPVDAMLVHEPRGKIFLIDIPYTEKALEDIGDKVDAIGQQLEGIDREVYYAAINTFGPREEQYLYRADEVENEVRSTAGIVSPDEIAGLYTPRIPVEKEFGDGFVEVRDTMGIGFRLKVATGDDVNHSIEVSMPSNAASEFQQNAMNSRKEFGEIQHNVFRQTLEVQDGCRIKYGDVVEPLDSYRDSVRSIYQHAVNPCLAKKTNRVY